MTLEPRLSEKEIEQLKEHGMYSEAVLADLLSDLYSFDEIFGEWAIDALIDALHEEIRRLREAKER